MPDLDRHLIAYRPRARLLDHSVFAEATAVVESGPRGAWLGHAPAGGPEVTHVTHS